MMITTAVVSKEETAREETTAKEETNVKEATTKAPVEATTKAPVKEVMAHVEVKKDVEVTCASVDESKKTPSCV